MSIDFSPIIQFLNDMAEKLTPSAQRVFELAVRQTITDGVLDLFGCLFLLVVVLVSWKYAVKLYKKYEKELFAEDVDTALGLWMIATILLTIILVFALVFVTVFGWLPRAISTLINPEYQTLLKLLELIK